MVRCGCLHYWNTYRITLGLLHGIHAGIGMTKTSLVKLVKENHPEYENMFSSAPRPVLLFFSFTGFADQKRCQTPHIKDSQCVRSLARTTPNPVQYVRRGSVMPPQGGDIVVLPHRVFASLCEVQSAALAAKSHYADLSLRVSPNASQPKGSAILRRCLGVRGQQASKESMARTNRVGRHSKWQGTQKHKDNPSHPIPSHPIPSHPIPSHPMRPIPPHPIP